MNEQGSGTPQEPGQARPGLTPPAEPSAESPWAPGAARAAAEPPTASAASSEPPAAVSPPATGRRRLPRWLPYLVLAVFPALIVGLGFALAGDGGNGGGGAGIVDGFIRLGPGDDSRIKSFTRELPPGFPGDFPAYPGAKVFTAFAIHSDRGANFFVVFTTADAVDRVFTHFLERLDKDPWQVSVARSGAEFTGLQFDRPADPEIDGSITIHHSNLDRTTSIFVSIEDVSSLARRNAPEPARFELKPSLKLPPSFPSDLPIYRGREASTITITYFERGAGTNIYGITFLTKNDQDDVISFYRAEFQKRGWQVTDSGVSSSRFQIGIDFQDGPRQEIQGSIKADTFDEDAAYTKVDLLVQVSVRRGRGN